MRAKDSYDIVKHPYIVWMREALPKRFEVCTCSDAFMILNCGFVLHSPTLEVSQTKRGAKGPTLSYIFMQKWQMHQ